MSVWDNRSMYPTAHAQLIAVNPAAIKVVPILRRLVTMATASVRSSSALNGILWVGFLALLNLKAKLGGSFEVLALKGQP